MSFQRYPAYKDSGVEWLGEVPAHWDVLRLKQACEVFPSNVDKHSRDDEPQVFLCNYTDVYYNEKITQDMTFMSATAAPDQISRFTLRAGDTIITKDSETADDIAISAYVPQDLPGVVCGYHLSMIRPKSGVSGAFVKRFFDSAYLKAKAAVSANGLTRVGLGQYAIDNLEVPLPPVAEQALIASFLDDETAKIDALVAEQEKLIELLKEKRQAVISHAVTKGLDPSVPMKDSGVEWLGEVPAHWEVAQFRRYVAIAEGQVNPEESPYSSMVLIAPNHVESSTGRVVSLETAAEQGAESGKYLCSKNDVIYSKIRPALRKVCIAPVDCLCSADMYPLKPHSGLSSEFLLWYMLSEEFSTLAVLESERVAMPKINRETLNPISIVVPPEVEQRAISSHLRAATEDFDRLVTEATAAIALLQERRTALISAAVTGQIDVRGWVPTEAIA